MNNKKVFDLTSYLIALVTFGISLFFIFQKTQILLDSVIGAALGAALVWTSYITIRACILAAGKDR